MLVTTADPATVPNRGELFISSRHEFLGYGLHASECRVRVYVRGENIVVVISETGQGTSVTNVIAQICAELLPDLVSADPTRRDSITWIEHWPAQDKLPESFDVVTFAHFVEANPRVHTREKLGSFRGPQWKRIERAELESLIGTEWE